MINTIFFAPCAWYMSYHLGAWSFLKESGFLSNIKILGGASSGSLVSYLLSAGIDEEELINELLGYADVYPGFKSWGNMSRIVSPAITRRLQGKSYNYENFIILSSFERKWPYFAPRIVVPNKNDLEEVKSAILSSCYIPFIYEDRPTWKDQFVIDGGLFVFKLNLPNTITVSPYETMSENIIGPEKDSEDYKLMNEDLLGSLCPNKENLIKIKNCGYSNAKKWFETYNKLI